MFDKVSYCFLLNVTEELGKWEGEREEDATRIDVHSRLILWSWTFSCDVGCTDPNSHSGSKERHRCWNSAPQILGFISWITPFQKETAEWETSWWTAINLPSCHRVQKIRKKGGKKIKVLRQSDRNFSYSVHVSITNEPLNFWAKMFLQKDVGRDYLQYEIRCLMHKGKYLFLGTGKALCE